jgi:hypothetical protein
VKAIEGDERLSANREKPIKEGKEMKSLTINLMLATAAMMVASAAASAQSMTVEIPFAFRANGAVLPPGSYNVNASVGENSFHLLNVEARKSVELASGIREDAPKEWISSHRPTLQFACGDGGCTLNRIWTATGSPAHVFSSPRNKEYASRSLAMVQIVGTRVK